MCPENWKIGKKKLKVLFSRGVLCEVNTIIGEKMTVIFHHGNNFFSDKDVLKVLHTMAKYESVIVAESTLERVQTLVDLFIEYYICGYQD